MLDVHEEVKGTAAVRACEESHSTAATPLSSRLDELKVYRMEKVRCAAERVPCCANGEILWDCCGTAAKRAAMDGRWSSGSVLRVRRVRV